MDKIVYQQIDRVRGYFLLFFIVSITLIGTGFFAAWALDHYDEEEPINSRFEGDHVQDTSEAYPSLITQHPSQITHRPSTITTPITYLNS